MIFPLRGLEYLEEAIYSHVSQSNTYYMLTATKRLFCNILAVNDEIKLADVSGVASWRRESKRPILNKYRSHGHQQSDWWAVRWEK